MVAGVKAAVVVALAATLVAFVVLAAVVPVVIVTAVAIVLVAFAVNSFKSYGSWCGGCRHSFCCSSCESCCRRGHGS